jgi:hypothetical protein
MNPGRRSSQLAGGVLLILLGAVILALQLYPPFRAWVDSLDWSSGWPLVTVAVGVFLFVLGVLLGAPGMAVPACIVGGIGLLLYWQNATGNWASWAYAWSLIPGFVGVGVILAGLLERRTGPALRGGGWLILISLILFLVFGTFLGGMDLLGGYWPVLLIVLGLIWLGGSLFGRRRRP